MSNMRIRPIANGATAAEKLGGTSSGVDVGRLSFPPPSIPRLPLLLHPCFTNFLPYSSFFLPVSLALRSGAQFTKYHTIYHKIIVSLS